jgi:hypothetical protein
MKNENDFCAGLIHQAIPDVAETLPRLNSVSMPPPVAQDWQVSPADGPDWELKHFTGGVEKIERQRDMLIFHFAAGGQVCVNHGVTYRAPERH